MKKYVMTVVAVAGLAAATPSFGAVNLIQNGGFEDGPLVNANPGFRTISGNANQQSLIPNWTVGGQSVDYIANYWQNNQNSGNSIDLNGNGPGRISQTITTVVGQLYKIVFFYSANPAGGNFPRSATVNFGMPGVGNAENVITAQADPTRTLTNMNWQRAEFYRKATSTSTTLTFFGQPAGPGGGPNGNVFGIALDSVSVSATPEPAAYASLLVGLGMAGFVARRRKRAMAKAAAAA
jgi:choice-of-anchor C domain-containing protein